MTHETLTAERIEEGRRLLAARETHQRCETVGMGWYGVGLPNEADLSIKAATSSRGYLWAPDARLLAWLWNNAPALLSAAATAREQAERIAELLAEREADALVHEEARNVIADLRADKDKLERENAWLRKIEKAAQRVIAHRRADGQYCVLTVDLDHLAALTGEQP